MRLSNSYKSPTSTGGRNASVGGSGGAGATPVQANPPVCPDTCTSTPQLKIRLCCRPASNPGARGSRLGASPRQHRCRPPARPGTQLFRPTRSIQSWEEHPGTTFGKGQTPSFQRHLCTWPDGLPQSRHTSSPAPSPSNLPQERKLK